MATDSPNGSGTETFASIEDAARSYAALPADEAPEEDNQVEEEARGDTPQDEDEGLTADDTDEQGDAPEEEADDSEGYGKGRFAADNAKVTMPDGSVTTIAELKKGNLLHGDWTRKSMAHAEQVKAFAAKEQTVQSFASELLQQQEAVAAIAHALLPKRPDPKMIEEGDVIGFNLAQDAYTRQVEMLGQINANIQQHRERLKAQEQEQLQTTRVAEAKLLVERAPEFAEPEKYAKFWQEAVKAGEHYGYSAEDLSARTNHVDYLILKDALAYRRIKAKSGQQQAKPSARPPVINGDRRRAQGETQRREANDAMARLNKSGSIKDGVAALLAMEPSPNR